MGLRLELKEGDRTLAVYGKKDVVGRMLDAADGTAQAASTTPAPKRKVAKRRKALGRGVEPDPDAGQ